MLLQLAQAVANATATLVLKGKNVASQCPDTAQQTKVIGAAKDTAMTTSQLVACVKLVVPTISSQMCQDQVVEAARQVAKAVGDTEDACKVCIRVFTLAMLVWSLGVTVYLFSFVFIVC